MSSQPGDSRWPCNLPLEFGGTTVNQQILAAIKFGVSQNKVIWRLLNLQCTINVRSRMLARQILAKTRNSPNSPNIIARQNLLIYSI